MLKKDLFFEPSKIKFVTDHFISRAKSGIISLQLNTNQKWLKYHSYNSETYGVYLPGVDLYSDDECEELIELEPFLDKNLDYQQFHSQCKDQIYFVFIPYHLLEKEKS